jgi:hypothetical protein
MSRHAQIPHFARPKMRQTVAIYSQLGTSHFLEEITELQPLNRTFLQELTSLSDQLIEGFYQT